ncbi:hypothetical protein H696_00775 [Fonticula alba]|uniref:Fatty acid desaturase domain-containing protein n=1 Tax=Fonticula alba TaxID=691883 RepID=A0A058ZFU9_FONAL|nr:hypothetical protein H696_00775 [Fonticula alba]KCV73234.1 hypothetical protein H696_00775 [Fonticula alba]|eukprot:XP_009492935.1 hypothetical protein H696_00775 [Fonticula alba]
MQAIGRDATVLFESYHLRDNVAQQYLTRLPELDRMPEGMSDSADGTLLPYPLDSPVFVEIKRRVRAEVLARVPAAPGKGGQRGGPGIGLGIAFTLVGWLGSWSIMLWAARLGWWPLSFAACAVLSLFTCHVALTLSHGGMHGNLVDHGRWNELLGLCHDIIGGCSLVWTYHHHVSHHMHTNDPDYDQDIFLAWPTFRFDYRLPQYWFHRFQHLYSFVLFAFLSVSIQYSDYVSLFTGSTGRVKFHGASSWEFTRSFLLKAANLFMLLGIPLLVSPAGSLVKVLILWSIYNGVLSFCLSWLFAVSHNIGDTKTLSEESVESWLEVQVRHSANWGGRLGNFLTGGLNYQIEHHLFPGMSYAHLPDAAVIVEEECLKAGIPYVKYPTLLSICVALYKFMRDCGQNRDSPAASVPLSKKKD